MHPDDPDLLFVSAAVGWPPHWYKLGRARGKIARSRDGGRTWTRLLGGLPDGQRALFGALTMAASDRDFAVYAADSDGQIFESTDGGDHWHMIADLAPVSKGDFYRAMAKGRPPIANLDDMAFNANATRTDRLDQGLSLIQARGAQISCAARSRPLTAPPSGGAVFI